MQTARRCFACSTILLLPQLPLLQPPLPLLRLLPLPLDSQTPTTLRVEVAAPLPVVRLLLLRPLLVGTLCRWPGTARWPCLCSSNITSATHGRHWGKGTPIRGGRTADPAASGSNSSSSKGTRRLWTKVKCSIGDRM